LHRQLALDLQDVFAYLFSDAPPGLKGVCLRLPVNLRDDDALAQEGQVSLWTASGPSERILWMNG
jgi:hypothetical protein